MRTLHADLVTAQKGDTADPVVAVVASNLRGNIRALDFADLYSVASASLQHGAAVAADGSLTRAKNDGAGNILQQRLTTPLTGPYVTWNNIGAGKGAFVAVAARGAYVAIVYTDAANTGIKIRESTDSGATFAAEVAVVTAGAALTALAVAYKNTGGDHAIAWTTATTLNLIKRTSGAYGAASASGISVAALNGVALCYGFDYELAITGQEVTTLKRTLWTLIFGDGTNASVGTWTAIRVQQQAEADASVTYQAPFLAYIDTYHLRYVEADAFTGGATRVYKTTLHPSTSYTSGAYTHRAPVPVDYPGVYGLAICGDAGASGYAYESAADDLRAASKAPISTTLTNDVLALVVTEREHATSAYVDIDNSSGIYTPGVAPLAVGNLVTVAVGYRTSSGVRTSTLPDLIVRGYEHRRTGGESVLRLLLEGGWETLKRNRQRTQIVHTAETYAQIVTRAMSRAGINHTLSGASSRATTVTPKFTIHPDDAGFDAVHEALAFLVDRVRMTQNQTAVMREPLAGDASSYAYGVAHGITELRVTTLPAPVVEAHAFGAAAFGEAISFTAAAQFGGTKEQMRDTNSATGATAAATATARLRRRAMDLDGGHLITPPNCGTELYDVIDVTDPLLNLSGAKRRVSAIAWRYLPLRGVYEHRLELMPV
jgi:hypothetical protein